MADYVYTIKPQYPFVEEITFETEVIKQSSLFHTAIGTPASWQSTCPAPRHPVQEITTRKTLISDDIRNLKEQRRTEYETEVIGYTFTLLNLNQTQRDNLVTFFNARKGRFDNFNIQYTYLFSGSNTLVRFDMDTLRIENTSYKRYEATITILRALAHRYIARLSTPQRKFILNYKDSDLSSLKDFFTDTAKGRSTTYNFQPSQIASHLDSTTYTVRFNSDEFLEKWHGDNVKTTEIELLVVV